MKTDRLILIGAFAAAALIMLRARAAAPAPATRQRTATVTVGPLLAGPESVYGHGQALVDAWTQRPSSSSSSSWDES